MADGTTVAHCLGLTTVGTADAWVFAGGGPGSEDE